MSKEQKVFVYDTSGGFSRFIKIKFENQFSVDVCKKEHEFYDKFVGIYTASFVVINKLEDLLVFSYCYDKVETVFVVSNFVEINEMLSKFSRANILDIRTTKQETFNTINFHLELSKLSNS